MKTIYYILFFFPLLASQLSAQWQEINPKLTSSNIFDIAWGIDNNNNDNDNVVIAVGGNNLVLRSVDGGQNWSRILLNADDDPFNPPLSVLRMRQDCNNSTNFNANFNGDRKQNLHGVAAGTAGNFLIVGNGDGDINHIRNIDRSVQSAILAFSNDNGLIWTQYNTPTTVDRCNTCPTNSPAYQAIQNLFAGQISQDLTFMDAVWSNNRWYIIGQSSISGVLFSIDPSNLCSLTIHHVSLGLSFNSIATLNNFVYFTGTSDKTNRVFRLNLTNQAKDSLNLSFAPKSISIANNLLVLSGGEVANTYDGTYRSMIATVPISFTSQPTRRIPNDPNYFVQGNINWRFGRASKFISTNNDEGYIFTDFGRIVKCSTTAMNPGFTNVYDETDKNIFLTPSERLYCAEASPNNQFVVVGGQLGNLWRLAISSGGIANTAAARNTLNTIDIPEAINTGMGVPLKEEIFDMINVNNQRVWMVGESRKILSAIPPQTQNLNNSWIIRDEGFRIKQMYREKDNDFHGISRHTYNNGTANIEQLWIVGQNKTILFGNIDATTGNVSTWNLVNEQSIKRSSNTHNDFTHNPSSHLNSIAFSSDQPCLGYAVGGSSLVFRTTDFGISWKQIVASSNPNTSHDVNNFYKVHYIPAVPANGGQPATPGRFIIVGERTILRLDVLTNACATHPSSDREVWTSSTVRLLFNSTPPGCEINRHFAGFQTGEPKGTQTYVLRNIQTFEANSVPIRLFAVGYLLNSELNYNTEIWTPAQRGLILTSADRGATWNEVFPVAMNNWGEFVTHSNGGVENNNANSRLFGITCSTTDAWVCGSSGYIIHSEDPNENLNGDPQVNYGIVSPPCSTSTITTPTFVGRWGDEFAFQMNGQTFRTINAICSITSNNLTSLIAAGEQGTIITTTNNNRGWGKPSIENNSPLSNDNTAFADYHILAYPNPVTQNQEEINIILKSNSVLGNHITVDLNNNLTELCYKKEITLQQNNLFELSFSVPTTTLQSGVYHICITCNGTRLCKKIIIHK
ncbi:MAG: hypothetical protein ACK5C0_03310 [Candidatus Kapaibacterium sp.]|jgi:hypothetical protein